MDSFSPSLLVSAGCFFAMVRCFRKMPSEKTSIGGLNTVLGLDHRRFSATGSGSCFVEHGTGRHASPCYCFRVVFRMSSSAPPCDNPARGFGSLWWVRRTLKDFGALKRVAIGVIAHALTPEEIKTLKAEFQKVSLAC